jgi:hypothetical protein
VANATPVPETDRVAQAAIGQRDTDITGRIGRDRADSWAGIAAGAGDDSAKSGRILAGFRQAVQNGAENAKVGTFCLEVSRAFSYQ